MTCYDDGRIIGSLRILQPLSYEEDKDYDYSFNEKVLGKVDDGTFHIGDIYSIAKDVAKTFVCLRCGGKEFNVGTSEHYTAIRCPKCKYEVCVHEG